VSDVVLVTGGSGFIGTWVLRDLLARDLTPIVFDVAPHPERWRTILGASAERVVFASGSLLDRERLRQVCDQHQVNRFIHLAALLTPACQSDPWSGCQVNVLGGVSLFEVARRLGGKLRGLSYASSIGVFGAEPDDSDADAKAVGNQPPNFYGAFKKSFEMIADQYWRHFGVASVGVRPHVVFGPEREQGLTAGASLAARAAVRGEPGLISYTGSAEYEYVEDVARAFVRTAFETPRGADVVDLVGEWATIDEVAAAIKTAVPGAILRIEGPPVPTHTPPRVHTITSLFPDWSATSLLDGMRKTADFYRRR